MLTLPEIVRTVWEIKQKTLVDMAVDRGCYIDQSQSLNIHMDQPNFGKLTSLHFYAWSKVSTFSLEQFSPIKDCVWGCIFYVKFMFAFTVGLLNLLLTVGFQTFKIYKSILCLRLCLFIGFPFEYRYTTRLTLSC